MKTTFLKAVTAIGEYKKVQCTIDKNSTPVIYKVIDDELTVNGKRYDYRDFVFSASQVLWGKWEIIE